MMPAVIAILVLLGIGAGLLFLPAIARAAPKPAPTGAQASPFSPDPQRDSRAIEMAGPTDLDTIFQKWGNKRGVDWRLLKAIATIESSLNPAAVNAADPSVGLMQILCEGWPNACRNRLPALEQQGIWPPDSPQRLLDPDYNVEVGSAIIKWNMQQYGMPRAIAVYNAFDQRTRPVSGPFGNQAYVDKVLREWERLKASP